MENRDLLKDQIEQLGKVMAKILSDFIGLKSNNDVDQQIKISNDRFQNELDIDIEKLLSLQKTKLRLYTNKRKLNHCHLETLSAYFKEVGLEKLKTSKSQGRLYLVKALVLLEIADEVSKTISLDRIDRSTEIKNVLQ